jgi:hypothetical protein
LLLRSMAERHLVMACVCKFLLFPVNSTLRSARVRGTSVLELADRC